MESFLTNPVLIDSFAISEENPYLENCLPPLIRLPRTVPFQIEDVEDLQQDFFISHYNSCFHDCTLHGFLQSGRCLDEIQIVSDRNCLRKLFSTFCIAPQGTAFYCKREDFTLMAENINGTIFLAKEYRYNPVQGSYGKGFELKLQVDLMPANYYRLIQYSLGELNCLVRFQVDGRDEHDNSIELKSRKQPNPRYGLGEDFFQNIWIQMALSDTKQTIIGLHKNGRVEEIKLRTLHQLQQLAKISDSTVNQAKRELINQLQRIRDNISIGRQCRVHCFADGRMLFELIPPVGEKDSFLLPLLSSRMRKQLLGITTEEEKEEEVEEVVNAKEGRIHETEASETTGKVSATTTLSNIAATTDPSTSPGKAISTTTNNNILPVDELLSVFTKSMKLN
jgi:hypothetical protein